MKWADGTNMDFDDWFPGEPNCAINANPDFDDCVKTHKETCVHVFQPLDYFASTEFSKRPIFQSVTGIAWNDAPCCAKLKSICRLIL